LAGHHREEARSYAPNGGRVNREEAYWDRGMQYRAATCSRSQPRGTCVLHRPATRTHNARTCSLRSAGGSLPRPAAPDPGPATCRGEAEPIELADTAQSPRRDLTCRAGRLADLRRRRPCLGHRRRSGHSPTKLLNWLLADMRWMPSAMSETVATTPGTMPLRISTWSGTEKCTGRSGIWSSTARTAEPLWL
jgi:hypothetical protein